MAGHKIISWHFSRFRNMAAQQAWHFATRDLWWTDGVNKHQVPPIIFDEPAVCSRPPVHCRHFRTNCLDSAVESVFVGLFLWDLRFSIALSKPCEAQTRGCETSPWSWSHLEAIVTHAIPCPAIFTISSWSMLVYGLGAGTFRRNAAIPFLKPAQYL